MARKELNMVRLSHFDFKNEVVSAGENITLEISAQLPASGSQKRDIGYEVRKSTFSDVLVCGA